MASRAFGTFACVGGRLPSDVLLAQDVFYLYQPKVSPTVETTLEKTLRAALPPGSEDVVVAEP
jgi:hypothetical protein